MGPYRETYSVHVKKVILSVAHGASVPEIALEEERGLEVRLLRWVACWDLLELHKQFTDKGNRPWLENSTFAYWWETLEVGALRVPKEEFATTRHDHLSLHFDGFMVRRTTADDVTAQALSTGAGEDGSCCFHLKKVSPHVPGRPPSISKLLREKGLLAPLPCDIEGPITECSFAMAFWAVFLQMG